MIAQIKNPSQENLTVIKGIGTARARRLQETLGVVTVGDLAVLSAEEVEKAFAGGKGIGSSQEIEGWISQARDLVVDRSEGTPVAVTAVVEERWQPFASFVVEFQERQVAGEVAQRISVQYMEGDVTKTWDDIVEKPVCHWMHQQVSDKIKTPQIEELIDDGQPQPEDLPIPVSPIEMSVGQLRVYQPPEAASPLAIGEAESSFIGFVRSDEASLFQVTLMADTAPQNGAAQPAYSIQMYARNLSMGINTPIKMEPAEDQGEAGALTYQALVEKGLLQPGRYRLGILLKEESSISGVNYWELPPFQIM